MAHPQTDPILTDIYRAQVVIPGRSGLAEDQWTNTWYFRNDDPLADATDVASSIDSVLTAFYDGAAANTEKISGFYADLFDRNAVKINVYDLGQTPPRTRHQRNMPLSNPTQSSNALPAEVAVAMSFYSDQNAPRYRGRIFLGPLNARVLGALAGGLHDARVASTFITTVVDRAENVLASSEPVTWVQVTRGGTSKPISEGGKGIPHQAPGSEIVRAGWVDNAFDTQRRRGVKASARTLFGSP